MIFNIKQKLTRYGTLAYGKGLIYTLATFYFVALINKKSKHVLILHLQNFAFCNSNETHVVVSDGWCVIIICLLFYKSKYDFEVILKYTHHLE